MCIYERVILKILTANHPKMITISTANFWKPITIRGGLIRGLSNFAKNSFQILIPSFFSECN